MRRAQQAICKQRRRPIKQTGYVDWHTEAERRGKVGWTQERCLDCKLWTRRFTPAESRKRALAK